MTAAAWPWMEHRGTCTWFSTTLTSLCELLSFSPTRFSSLHPRKQSDYFSNTSLETVAQSSTATSPASGWPYASSLFEIACRALAIDEAAARVSVCGFKWTVSYLFSPRNSAQTIKERRESGFLWENLKRGRKRRDFLTVRGHAGWKCQYFGNESCLKVNIFAH